ncbi:MAG TPA: hypothetical protein VNQ73_14600 [Ilumatobacter sp.]|nr:hypothetical protein [Ilumatobacter sp.]
MTIRPGQEWGRPAGDVSTATPAGSDADLADQVAAGAVGPFAVSAGDLHRAVGAPKPGAHTTIVPVDALAVQLDEGPERLVVAHLVARRSWWRGPVVAVCNVDYVGTWNVAPRAHPGDGRANVVDVSPAMSTRARWQAWRRLPQGTHLPHPAITTRSIRTVSFEFESPMRVWLDGVPSGTARHLKVTVRPDAFELLL